MTWHLYGTGHRHCHAPAPAQSLGQGSDGLCNVPRHRGTTRSSGTMLGLRALARGEKPARPPEKPFPSPADKRASLFLSALEPEPSSLKENR